MTEHTSRHYEQELRGLKEKILLLGGRVEEMIATAMTSLTARDPDLARKVIESDTLVDAADPSRMGDGLTDDGDHPSIEGHRLLGEQAFRLDLQL